jgi:hypothetical protein
VKPDLILHVGVGQSGKIRLETIAQNVGYCGDDIESVFFTKKN